MKHKARVKIPYIAASLIAVLCFAILAVLLARRSSAPPGSPTKSVGRAPVLKLCSSAITGTQMVPWYAFEKGIFEKYNLQVELVPLENGKIALTALIAGQVDACQVAGSNVVNAAIAGEDLVMIGGTFNRLVYSLFVQPEITDASGLKGKSVAVSSPGGASDTMMHIALQELGLDPEKDVTIVAIGSSGDFIAALAAGNVSGIVLAEPLSAKARQLGFRELLDLSELPLEYETTTITVRRQFLKERRPDALNLMRSLVEAMAQMRRDPNGSKEVLAKYLKLDVQADADLLRQSYEKLVLQQMAELPYPTQAGVQALIEAAAAENPAAGGMKAEAVIDGSLMEELEKSGFVESLKK